jgi:16S rRNA (cytidine1402-2'-O)-methyltransferase
MSTLYLVATPIGNLEDVTLRALRVLREVDLIAAEDTRTTRKLLSHYDIHTPLTSYNDRNKRAKTPYLLEQLGRGDVALVSEAGTPTISDPGQELVVAAYALGARVVPVPGPSVVTAALAAAGLPSRTFTYLGFLPRQPGARRRLLRSVAERPETLVAFEAPHRLRDSLADMREELGDRPIAVCRELTKLYEEVFRGSISEALERFAEPRGEFTLVVAGAEPSQRPGDAAESEARAREEMRRLRGRGATAQEAVGLLSRRYGVPRRRLYQIWLSLE